MTTQTLQWSEYRNVIEKDGNRRVPGQKSGKKEEMLTAGFIGTAGERERRQLGSGVTGVGVTRGGN